MFQFLKTAVKKTQITLIATVVIFTLAISVAGCTFKNSTINPKKQATQQQSQIESKLKSRLPALVIRVIDGDTIEVSIGETKEIVRLLGIDAPESVDPERQTQCFGIQAAEQLRLLVNSKRIYLGVDRFAPNRDKYERLLRYVYNENGEMINLEMIKKGYAFAYTPGALEHFSDLRYFEKQARESNIGLWNRAVCPYNMR